jgi:hypothetical protein
VLKCGGGKALTKAADETPFKFHLPVDEVNKAGDVDTLVVCDVQVGTELEEKVKVAPIRKDIKPIKGVLGKVMPELYNLENCVKTEKPVKIDLDLDLYQMEKV